MGQDIPETSGTQLRGYPRRQPWDVLHRNQERKSSLNIKFLGRISGGYPGGHPSPKTFTPSLGTQEHKVSCEDVPDPKARTSMTRGGLRKTLCKNFGLICRSLRKFIHKASVSVVSDMKWLGCPAIGVWDFSGFGQDAGKKGGLSLRGVAVTTETAMTAETVRTVMVASLSCILYDQQMRARCSPEPSKPSKLPNRHGLFKFSSYKMRASMNSRRSATGRLYLKRRAFRAFKIQILPSNLEDPNLLKLRSLDPLLSISLKRQ